MVMVALMSGSLLLGCCGVFEQAAPATAAARQALRTARPAARAMDARGSLSALTWY